MASVSAKKIKSVHQDKKKVLHAIHCRLNMILDKMDIEKVVKLNPRNN